MTFIIVLAVTWMFPTSIWAVDKGVDGTKTSKACYGSPGQTCTQHNIRCGTNRKIAVYDADYTDNTECTPVGLSYCSSVKPNRVTERGHQFNNIELSSLYNKCSTATSCVYHAPRREPALDFSVVKYQCIDSTLTETTVSHVSSADPSTLSGSSRMTALSMTHTVLSAVTMDVSTHAAGKTGSNTGAIAGGVVATVLAVLVVTLVSVWIIRRRRQNGEVNEKTSSLPKDAKPDTIYSLAGNLTQNNYHEIQTPRTENGDYDYATADGMVLPSTTNTYFIIEPAGKETVGDNSKISAAEGDYDHIGDKPSPQTSDYDTTVLLAQPGHIGEDGYGYNHFQKKVNLQTHQNDYDTAASETKAVAQINTTEGNTDEDDYDHLQRGTNASETVSSPYDTTSGIILLPCK